MNPERQLRLLQIVFILLVLMFFAESRWYTPDCVLIRHRTGAFVQLLFILVAAETIRVGFKVQRIMLCVRSRSLPPKLKSTPLSRWRAGNVMRLATTASVGLQALVLHLFNGSAILIYLLFASSLLLLLIWRPGTIPSPTEQLISEDGDLHP
jgi:hypothetical protein